MHVAFYYFCREEPSSFYNSLRKAFKMNNQQTPSDDNLIYQDFNQREQEFLTILEGFLRRSSLEQTMRLPRWMI